MKFKHVLFAFFIIAAVFAGIMAFLVFHSRPEADSHRAGLEAGFASNPVRDQGRTVSGKGGKAVIAYAGDIEGSLDPCG
jgi:lipopolysaccharide export LptBFGC system permease protein LptF